MPPAPQVLLVNDDDDGLFLLERAVAKEFPDAVFSQCKDGHAALEFLRSRTVDAIITDNRMPEMSGIALTAAIRKFDTKTPILMVTASEHIEPEARAAGVTLFVATGSWEEVRHQMRVLLRGAGPA